MKPKNNPEIEELDELDAADDDTVDAELEDRTRDYSSYKYIIEQLGEIWAAVDKAFEDKAEQNAIIDECWDLYNCVLNSNQVFVGSAQVYVPIVHDAITARETRFINTLFPQNNRYCDIVASDGRVPHELIALMDYYVRSTNLRTQVIPAMLRGGDCSGNYSLYVDWVEHTRHVTSKERVAEVTLEEAPVDGSPEYDDVSYEEIVDERPGVTVLDNRNLIVLPVTVDNIQDAEIVSVTLRFSKAKLQKWAKKGMLEKKAVKTLLAHMNTAASKQQPDTGKKNAEAAGVTTDSKGNKVALIQQVWCKLKIRGEYRRMVTHFAGSQMVLGCKRNPYWCDRVPVITQPIDKQADSIWAPPPVNPGVRMLQYQANDVANMGFDSAQYALQPIVLTDPEKNPRAGSMVLAMASVWLADPNSTKFANFPPLWKDAFAIIGACKDQIFQSLSVNPAMIPHANAGKKPSQAQIAQEQQVALESTADNTGIIQEGILAELLEWFYELDYQYRDKAVTVKKFGQLGLQADMDQVEPFQVRQRYEFRWYGTEGFKAAQQVQQQISWLNVLSKLPKEQLNGRKLDLGPALDAINCTILGPRVAPHVLVDERHQLTMDPRVENDLLRHNFPVQAHDMDDDMAHIQAHMAEFAEQLKLPPEFMDNIATLVRGHILEHMKQAKAKAMAQKGARPGSVGAPRPGAQAQLPTGVQNPPGAVSPDNMPLAMPRKA